MFGLDSATVVTPDPGFESTAFMRAAPHPGIAKPESGQKDNIGGFITTVRGGDPDMDVIRRLLRVLDEHVKIAVPLEYAGVNELVFRQVECRGCDSLESIDHTGRRLVDICRAPSGKSAWVTNRDKNSTP